MPDFIHRLDLPAAPDGTLIVQLHGSGRTEEDLMPFCRALAPGAAILGIRGRCMAEGVPRWYERLTPVKFDQHGIHGESAALAVFVMPLLAGYRQVTWVGYSNGANMIAALLALRPGLVSRAVLMRAMVALETLPDRDLSATSILMLTGRRDPYSAYAPRLEDWLIRGGAQLESLILPDHHGYGERDLSAARGWMDQRISVS